MSHEAEAISQSVAATSLPIEPNFAEERSDVEAVACDIVSTASEIVSARLPVE
jgi:hypothetical protein